MVLAAVTFAWRTAVEASDADDDGTHDGLENVAQQVAGAGAAVRFLENVE